MALCEVRFFGAAIEMQTAMSVIVPDAGEGPWPVFYLLHGLSDDHTIWGRRTSIERYVAGLPLIVVMPTGGRGWYMNAVHEPGRRFEDHIVQDVVGYVDRLFPTVKSRAGRVIGGLSMGGLGAVRLALKYPEVFAAATSHSGAVLGPLYSMAKRPPEAQMKRGEFEGVLGEKWFGSAEDTRELAKACPKERRPKLRLDCGVDDFLIQDNRDFHAFLDGMGYAHEYAEYPGAHTWGYWDEHVQEAVRFHCGVLGIG